MRLKVQLALCSSRIDLNLATDHDFRPGSRGHARGAQRANLANLMYLLAMTIALSSVT